MVGESAGEGRAIVDVYNYSLERGAQRDGSGAMGRGSGSRHSRLLEDWFQSFQNQSFPSSDREMMMN